ncbi:hypothetical protein L1887_61613 [Cichorium endivia]|nr:hypothetical protein L1887_61613 [Cichorium endivia]
MVTESARANEPAFATLDREESYAAKKADDDVVKTADAGDSDADHARKTLVNAGDRRQTLVSARSECIDGVGETGDECERRSWWIYLHCMREQAHGASRTSRRYILEPAQPPGPCGIERQARTFVCLNAQRHVRSIGGIPPSHPWDLQLVQFDGHLTNLGSALNGPMSIFPVLAMVSGVLDARSHAQRLELRILQWKPVYKCDEGAEWTGLA